MKISELFTKDITRSINGVIKVDQRDAQSIWQELDEFVITKELRRHFDRFFSTYAESVDRPDDPDIAGKMGVWVSGFFGSGKSHFIKALSYLFSDQEIAYKGQSKKPIHFIEGKVEDALLVGNMKKSLTKNTDVILFNIDSKADQSKGRDAILSVFLKVLNELQGYSPDHPHIAHMERYLDRNGKFKAFVQQYHFLTGSEWLAERENYMFNQDSVVESLSKVLEQSVTACHKWIDHAESDFALTVENFAKWTKEYLDSKGPDHRLLFFVDEIGQFIGQDGHLMLNLQTIVENLGVVCQGRAWVVVTSQEDIDTILGALSNARSNDFSKIQGRFKTRLSLSSANTDEVIQSRLLEKKPEVVGELKGTYSKNADILKNQLSFSRTGMSLYPYRSEDDFVRNYPFIPYQFQLIQKVFETIRRAGATGLHLSRGERSMLDAFQYAGKIAVEGNKGTGILVPLYWFYPSIESFLDTSVRRTIDQAQEKPTLNQFDIFVLQTLFMIRYVQEVKGNVDNLVTLCIEQIDEDRFALKKKIEEALQKLEKETLIGRSGEDFFFLTNEERDISREIKNTDLEFGEENRQLGNIIFEDIYKGDRKHTYSATNSIFDINRLCDMYAIGGKVDEGLLISVITPLFEDYNLYDKAKCVMESSNDNGYVLIKLPENKRLDEELRIYLKTEKYISRKADGNPEVERILRERKEENRQRKTRLLEMVKEMLSGADYFAAGQPIKINSTEPIAAKVEALDYLIENTFNKMCYIENPTQSPQMEVQSVLRANDLGQQSLNLKLPEFNPRAIEDIREYVDLCTRTSKQIIMHDLVTKRYHNRPYGWNDWETVLLLTRLIVAGDLQLQMHGDILEPKRIYEQISKTSNWRKIAIKRRKTVSTELLEQTRKLGKELFGQMGPDNEDGLFGFFREHLTQWQNALNGYKTLADTGNYPGKNVIDEGLRLANILLNDKDSFAFINRLNERKDDLLQFAEEFHDINNFYKTQKPVWEKLRSEYNKFVLNQYELQKDEGASSALVRMKEILEAPAPYGLIAQAEQLINKVAIINDTLISAHKHEVLTKIDKRMDELDGELKKAQSDEVFQGKQLRQLTVLKDQLESQKSIAHIQQIGQRIDGIFEQCIASIAKYLEEKQKQQQKPDTPQPEVKPIVTVKSRELSPKVYLETKEDVQAFLAALEKRLNEAIENNTRIRVD